MLVEYTFHCERAGCESHVRTASAAPLTGILVTELPLSGRQEWDVRWLCCWECVLHFAAARSPLEQVDI